MEGFYSDIQWCIKLCNFLGVNPFKQNQINQFLLFLFWLTSITGSISFTILMLCSNEDMLNVKNLTDVTTNLLMFPHGIVKLVVLFFNKSSIKELMERTKDTFWTPEDTNDIKQSQRLGTFLKKFFFNCVIFCITSTIIKPFVNGDGAKAYAKYKPDNFPRYFFLILEDTACSAALLSISCLDIVILILLMMAEVQFRMLNTKLNNLFDPENGKQMTKQEITKRVKECVDHQNFLIDFLDQFSATFSGVTLFFLGDIILTMCMRMYIISSDTTDMNYRIEALFHLIAGLNQIVLCYSIPAQALMDQADEISNSAYFSKWYEYPQYAKNVWQIMVRDARRIEITAGGFVMIDLKMFMAAVKTIISYCMFLRTVSLVD